ncbi:hypothetical protein [Streptomyces similanensis]|uniref:Uncharacterized protein n=1 Tax=Streptomyces similanensis TaxID=1274988 RepID=A0ABP9LLM1_9ACTN
MSTTETMRDPWTNFVIGYDSRRVQQIQVRDHIDGIDLVETVTVRPLRVWEKVAGGLVELHGEAAEQALEAFWVQDDNEINNGENDR